MTNLKATKEISKLYMAGTDEKLVAKEFKATGLKFADVNADLMEAKQLEEITIEELVSYLSQFGEICEFTGFYKHNNII